MGGPSETSTVGTLRRQRAAEILRLNPMTSYSRGDLCRILEKEGYGKAKTIYPDLKDLPQIPGVMADIDGLFTWAEPLLETSLNGIRLSRGAHATPAVGLCIMEVVADQTGEGHTHLPSNVSPFLREVGWKLNDYLPGPQRQQLLQFARRFGYTICDPQVDNRRGVVLLDYVLKEVMVPTLNHMGLSKRAGQISRRKSLSTVDDVEWTGDILRQVIKEMPAEPRELNAAVTFACDGATDLKRGLDGIAIYTQTAGGELALAVTSFLAYSKIPRQQAFRELLRTLYRLTDTRSYEGPAGAA